MSSEETRRTRLAGNALARIGMDAGYLTAQKRADALGISRSHLLHVERGTVWPSLRLMERMASAYVTDVPRIDRAFKEARKELAQRMLEQSHDVM